jgi:hypothetical protein
LTRLRGSGGEWAGAKSRNSVRSACDNRRSFRPEIIGGTIALHGDGGFTQAVYFTSEEAAREGERKEPTPELKALLYEDMALNEGDLVYFDLRDPWLHSPR